MLFVGRAACFALHERGGSALRRRNYVRIGAYFHLLKNWFWLRAGEYAQPCPASKLLFLLTCLCSVRKIMAIIPNTQFCSPRNRVQPLTHGGNGQTRAQSNQRLNFKRNISRGKEDSTDNRRSSRGHDLSAIVEEAEESKSSSVAFSSQQPSGQSCCQSNSFCEASSLHGVSESTIQYGKTEFSDGDVYEFPPCPD